jgi:hypothetical protein
MRRGVLIGAEAQGLGLPGEGYAAISIQQCMPKKAFAHNLLLSSPETAHSVLLGT